MIDPILSLAFGMHSNKGAYALLLGSGVSRSAGIPTGWEVVLDLARKLAAMKGEDCEPDPVGWFQKTFDAERDYDKLLNAVAKLPAERSQLLRGYFEPTNEEREQGPKVPTDAHKAIAKLILHGIVSALDFLRSAPTDNDPLEFIFGDLLETFTENETKALAALTYFTQPVEVKLIAELAKISKAAAETALGDLSSRALVVPDEEEKNFALVPMVADFLRRKRPEAIAETGSRLEQRAYALIVENGYRKHDHFPVLDATWHTVVPALSLFLAGPNLRLQTVCTALFNFLEFTGRWDECLFLSQQAETKAVASRQSPPRRLVGLSRRLVSLSAPAGGRGAGVCRPGDSALGDREGRRPRARLFHTLAWPGHQLNSDYPAAIAAYRNSLELNRSVSAESFDVAIDLCNLAIAERLSGDFAATERDLREALRIAHAVGDAEAVASYTGHLADLALDCEDWPAAETLTREALPLSENLGRQTMIAYNCHRLGKALVQQGKVAEALPHARRAVEIFTRLRHPDREAARATLRECES